ncbi:TonB-dependent receptor [Puteibacter caeruleilacunae]|nr:TonB-dependent receptor [Puteibacter caeruleilacunae]
MNIKHLWKECKLILFMGLWLFAVLPTYAAGERATISGSAPAESQQTKERKIEGKVLDENGDPLIGVTVFIRATGFGTVTDASGLFHLVVEGDPLIELSFIGYETIKVATAKKSFIKVNMKPNTSDLDEVVVVAYGTKKKATVTGALTTVETEELIRTPATSVVNSLAGVMPGVTTIQGSGQPGKDAAKIYVRGTASLGSDVAPLILVDGVERPFHDLDPNEIESISVLKDASSTAVFGVRGANGVVLVTTKQGLFGKPQISFSSSMGIEKPDDLYQSASSYDYAKHWNYMMDADNNKNKFSPEAVEAFRTGSDPIMYPSVDWADYMFKDYYIQSRHNVSVSGGAKKVTYFVSLGYQYQNGLMKSMEDLQGYDNNFKNRRYNYRSNITVNLTETTKMKVNLGGVYNELTDPIICTGLNGSLGHMYNRPFVYATRWTLPFASPGFVDGKHYKLKAGRGLLPTGFGMREGIWALYGYGYRNVNSNRLNMDIDISQDLASITKGLKVSVKGAYNVNYQTIKAFRGSQPTFFPAYRSTLESPTLATTDPSFDKEIVLERSGRVNDLNYAEKSSRGRNWYIEGRVNYNRSFNNHNVGGLFLYNQSRKYYPGSYNYIPLSYIGYVGRFTYNYMQRYLLDISMGYNGSENFAPGSTRYGFFPSVSAGWVVSEEGFAKGQNIFTYMKLRGSIGKVGSDKSGSRFLYMPETWNSGKGLSFGVDNTTLEPAYVQGTPGNREVTWETSTKTNLGIDVKFIDDKLSVTADVYSDKREGILINPKSIPGIIATSSPKLNIGKVTNKGYEILIGWQDNTHPNFKYNLSANLSYAKNKIIDQDELPSDYSWQLYEGGSTGRGGLEYKFLRLYQREDFIEDVHGNLTLNPELPQPSSNVSPGDAMYEDVSGDHIVNDLDKMVWGRSSIPEYTFGFNSNFTYKRFSLFMQWMGVTNVNKMAHVGHRQIFGNPKNMGLNQMWVDNVWTPDRTDSPWPRATKNRMAWNGAESTLWDLDASYIRLKNLSVSYNIDKKFKLIEKLGIKQATITLSGYNLFTFDRLEYFDPEGDDITNWNGSYPLTRIYNCSVKVNF